MHYGPCGGVRADGQCEMRPGPCAFPDIVLWPQAQVHREPLPSPPLILADFSCVPFDADDARSVASRLAPTCDAVLVGEHQNRPDFPPTLLSRLIMDSGALPWISLSCRDRNQVVLEQELRGLAYLGVDTVLCVTGDGRGYDVRPDVAQTFDLDGPRLVEMADDLGLTPAVPETPTAPPVDRRPLRLVQKQHAGARVAVLNHVTSPAAVAQFMAAARAAGLTIPVLAAVAVFTDSVSATVLQGLPGLELDPGVVEHVLAAPDPTEAGIEAAAAEAEALLSIDGIAGVNLSGSATASGSRRGAEIKAEVGARIRARA
ncbi:methylenetetrahydrofolate reductase [Mycobacterium sp. SMC-4]|uniref:methylenetetrahydrofolate reductase n=1 Tax=Mycobacterium sp. SMC-4 TaxID=2857059 RepID=UPI0021B23C54|nr:methylenetetrahydrofolate reductase [Mycobacterium sp. SMC-4]UXA20720.1 methylenetetrahydrofolate reductase [Mycobacterium sp. SMC-4]